MKKKILKGIGWCIFIIVLFITIYNFYVWFVSGKQKIRITLPEQAYANNELYASISAQDYESDLETKSKIKLLDKNGHKVKYTQVKYNGNESIISVPNVEEGTYYIKATVSSKKGKDTIKKKIYIKRESSEDVVINLDKGIYKPGDTINYRALMISKNNQEPITTDINVSIYDGNDNRVYNEDVKTSEYGIVSGKFALANEINSGFYKLIIKTKSDEYIKQFKVNPYVTPKYEVSINYNKETYMVSDLALININAKYFFGEPVKEADLTVFIDDVEFKKVKTDDKGEAIIEYPVSQEKEYSIRVEAVDSSNYYIEKSSKFYAVTDKFKIQLYTEYNNKLIPGKTNNIYVLTSNNDGTPLEAYLTVTSDDFTKQIATNKDGVGVFSIGIEGGDGDKLFNVVADDKKGNKIEKKFEFEVNKSMTAISTDKIKYNQGDDIKIKISGINVESSTICVFQNDKLIQMAETDSEDMTINLDDTFGLIDIYLLTRDNNRVIGANSNDSAKKTIFIEPNKKLSIGVTTDKKEYKPGEKITISFDAKDENNSNVDAALLVSMLDNSILSLAQNDLSIDNIKLALKDIKFSDELDAASLYSCIVNDSSEQTMSALLLKQNYKSIGLRDDFENGEEQKENAGAIMTIFGIIAVVMIIAYILVKSPKARKLFKHIPNIVIIEICVMSLIIIPLDLLDIYVKWFFIPVIIMVLAFYILIAQRISKQFFSTTYWLFIIAPLLLVLELLCEEFSELIFVIFLSIVAVALFISVLLYKLLGKKKPKVKKITWNLITTILNAIRMALIIVIAIIMIELMYGWLYSLDDEAVVGIVIVIIYVLDYIENIIIKKLSKSRSGVPDKEAKQKESNYEDKDKNVVFLIISLIGAIALFIVLVANIYNSSHNAISEAGAMPGRTPSSINVKDYEASDSSGSAGGSGGFISKGSALSQGFPSPLTNSKAKNSTSTEIENNANSVTQHLDNKVRNIFLESMCFVPELIINNGSGKLDLELSDNITTWTIQTVGNTKDGRIGYGILDGVKVSKEFFVDFELPKNLTEGDKVSIPVTVYNYTNNSITTNINIQKADWFTTDNYAIGVTINPQSTNMAYIPITVIKTGINKFRTEVAYNSLSDIVEKECTITPNGYKVEKVVSTGTLDNEVNEDILFLDDMIPNTAKAKVKIYKSGISKTIEGMDKIFKMPTGCFEQVSSSLYPDIVALKYMEDNKIIDEELREKAINYISSGYQKLLTYEVSNEKGGYSLYGRSPAETVLTAYGLMEFSDLSKVYKVDEKVINNMNDFLYKKQNLDGSFQITGGHTGGTGLNGDMAKVAYVVWALSESNPNDDRLDKSIEYLKKNIDKAKDNYTIALIANTLVNIKDKDAKDYLDKLLINIKTNGDSAYLESNISDYYGSRSSVQNCQTVALTSMALSKSAYKQDVNKMLINYLMNSVDTNGMWHSTQATILSLKALNTFNTKNDLSAQTIKVKMNSKEENIEIKENSLDYYEVSFDNLNKENKLIMNIEKGDIYYEVVEEYYIPYEKVKKDDEKVEIKVECNNNLKVNEILTSKIQIINRDKDTIANGMVTISIPQGFVTIEESLELLVHEGLIEKYETTYNNVNIYLREFEASQVVDLELQFRASYPVDVTGMAVRAYDYYNPMIEGMSTPIKIIVTQ